MSFKFVPIKDFHLKKGVEYYLFESGQIITPKVPEKREGFNIECVEL
jgi:hypothetical protein